MSRRCEICGKDICSDHGRCTNSRCSGCHQRYCTPGGSTEPGHGRGWPQAAPKASSEPEKGGAR